MFILEFIFINSIRVEKFTTEWDHPETDRALHLANHPETDRGLHLAANRVTLS